MQSIYLDTEKSGLSAIHELSQRQCRDSLSSLKPLAQSDHPRGAKWSPGLVSRCCSHELSCLSNSETATKPRANESEPTVRIEFYNEPHVRTVTNNITTAASICLGSGPVSPIAKDVEDTTEVMGDNFDKKLGREVNRPGICRRNLCATGLYERGEGHISTAILTPPAIIDEISNDECCSILVESCASNTNMSSESARSTLSRNVQAANSTIKMAFKPNLGLVDVENGVPRIERIILQVLGMTCIGCEKKLSRVLTTLSEVSAVKLSLLISQAQFDFLPSQSVTAETIAGTVQSMTDSFARNWFILEKSWC